MDTVSINQAEFQLISSLIYRLFGIRLTEQKRTLVVERLQKVLRKGGFASFKDYYDYVVADPSAQALLELIDRISTNHTFFYREQDHFENLRQHILPQITARCAKSRVIRIWSAGCSSGEEPYTLAMVLADYFGGNIREWDIGILATDISVTALAKANSGQYHYSQLEHLPAGYRTRFVSPQNRETCSIQQDIRKLILFRRLNLMNPEYPFKGKFDIIFCRNVMIYFDETTRNAMVDRFHRYIQPEGYLFVSHSETLVQYRTLYRSVFPAIYQKL